MILSLLLAAMTALAQTPEQPIPYYGEDFYQHSSSAPAPKLREMLKQILQMHHQETDGGFDKIVKSCSGGGCYVHTSIGYGRAREFLLGDFYLVKQGNHYAIREMYCQEMYGPEKFRGGKPGPRVVPDNNVLNVEHTWPQSRFTGRFAKDLQKADLHHLFPTDSKMNSSRSSFPFGEVVRDEKQLNCDDSKLGHSDRGGSLVFEPPQPHRGNVARALFYFSVRYETAIDPSQEAFLRRWHKEDPVDEEERVRNDRIHKLQGTRNPFIDHPDLAERISDY